MSRPDLILDLIGNRPVFLQERLGVLTALFVPFIAVLVPSTRLFDLACFDPKIEQFAHL